MSIKLHHGYRLTTHNFVELRGKLRILRAKFEQARDSHFQMLLTRQVVEHVDRVAVGLLEDTRSVQEITSHYRQEIIKKINDADSDPYRSPSYDVKCEVLIIPCTSRKTLALLYSHLPKHQKLWEKQDWVLPYPYWNNTDRPEDVSKEKWRRRRLDWEDALGEGIPSWEGFSFLLCQQRFPHGEIQFDHRVVPSVPERALSIAKERLQDEYAKQFYKDLGLDQDNDSFAPLLDMLMGYSDYRKTDEGKKRLDQMTQEFIPKIHKDSFERCR